MEEEFSNLKRDALAFALVSDRLSRFAGRIAALGLSGKLDAAALAEVGAQAVLDLKNDNFTGLPIEQEAEVLGKAIEQFEQAVEFAIAQGRKREIL